MEITDSQHEFSINLVGDKTKQTYLGDFKAKCLLTPLEKISADREYRELMGENIIMASDETKKLAFALSQLKYRLIEYPPFWDNRTIGGGHIQDSNIIAEVFNKAIEAEEKYIETKVNEAKEIEKRLQNAIKKKHIEKSEEEEIEKVID